MKCAGCEKKIPNDIKECPYCGRAKNKVYLARNSKCSFCGAINGPERKTCWNCKRPLKWFHEMQRVYRGNSKWDKNLPILRSGPTLSHVSKKLEMFNLWQDKRPWEEYLLEFRESLRWSIEIHWTQRENSAMYWDWPEELEMSKLW